MKNIKNILKTILMTIPLISSVQAAGKSAITIEPVVGYERVQKLVPTPHSNDRLIYGVRGSYGMSILAVEAEVTQGRDTESFPNEDLTIKEVATNAKIGLRSSIVNTRLIRWYLRAGGHARQSEITTTELGVTTVVEPGIRISPYAGTGLVFNFNNTFKLNAGVTVIFTGKPKGSDREYQSTLGFAIKI